MQDLKQLQNSEGSQVTANVLHNKADLTNLPQKPLESRLRTSHSSLAANHLDLLDCPEIEADAIQTWRDTFTVMRSQLAEQIALGKRLIDIRYSLHTTHGEEAGEKKFNAWLKSKDWGAYGGGWGRTCLALAEWWMKLPEKLQGWLLNNIQKWSAGAIKRFAAATEIGIDFCIGLVKRGKQSAESIKRAANSQKLKLGEQGTVVSGDFKGTTGTVLAMPQGGDAARIAPDKITMELPNGVRADFAPEDVEKQRGFGKTNKKGKNSTEPDALGEPTTTGSTDVPAIVGITIENETKFAVGERIVVLSDDKGRQGARGIIVGEDFESNRWAVQLDDGAEGMVLFCSSQLRSETIEDVNGSGEKIWFSRDEVEQRIQAEREKLMQELRVVTEAVRTEETAAELQASREAMQRQQIQMQKLQEELEEKNREVTKYQEVIAENQELNKRIKELEAQRKNQEVSESIEVGKRVVVAADDKGWKGCTGVVDQQHNADSWWVRLDYVVEQGSSTRHLFKTAQLRDESRREVFTLEDFHTYARNERNRLDIDLSAIQTKTKLIDDLLPSFAAIASSLGFSGWSSNGYSNNSGERHRGIEAVLCFMRDLVSNQPELEF